MVCGLLYPCCKGFCGCKAAGYTSRLSFWYGPIAGMHDIDADSCVGKGSLKKWDSGGLPPMAKSRGEEANHVATFYISVGDLPSKPGVIHKWHAPDRLSADQRDRIARIICMTMHQGSDVCYCPSSSGAKAVGSAVGPQAEAILKAVGLDEGEFKLTVDDPPAFKCGREPMYGCVYLDYSGGKPSAGRMERGDKIL